MPGAEGTDHEHSVPRAFRKRSRGTQGRSRRPFEGHDERFLSAAPQQPRDPATRRLHHSRDGSGAAPVRSFGPQPDQDTVSVPGVAREAARHEDIRSAFVRPDEPVTIRMESQPPRHLGASRECVATAWKPHEIAGANQLAKGSPQGRLGGPRYAGESGNLADGGALAFRFPHERHQPLLVNLRRRLFLQSASPGDCPSGVCSFTAPYHAPLRSFNFARTARLPLLPAAPIVPVVLLLDTGGCAD